MFILIFTVVLLAMQYIALLWTATNTPYLNNIFAVKLLPALLTLLLFGAMFLTRTNASPAAVIFTKIMYIWLGAMFLWFSVCMLFMFTQIICGFFKLTLPSNLGLYAFAVTAILTAASLFTAAQMPKVTKLDIKNPFANGKTLKIVQVSDAHLGIGVSAARFKKLTALIQSLNPDIIVFTGDIIEETNINTQQYIDALKSLTPLYGKYAVLGNHEYYRGVHNNIAIWEEAAIHPIQNDAVHTAGINIIGINDIKTAGISKAQFDEILKGTVEKNQFNLLLSHTPLYFEDAANLGVNLMLSGHTHNGQIWPFKYLAKLSFKYINGLYQYGNSNIYVTSGTFFWGPPMRLFTKNEIVLITLS